MGFATNDADGLSRRTTVEVGIGAGIRTKFYGPTDRTGSRIKVWRSDGTYTEDPARLTWRMDDSLSVEENHRKAVEVYVAVHNAAGHDWSGRWVMAFNGDGYVATRSWDR